MKKIIIGIHGLANKPEPQQLADWWQEAIQEGLRHIEAREFGVNFTMAYWADRLYKQPLHNDPLYAFDSLYNDEPYIRARPGDIKPYQDGLRDQLRARVLDMSSSVIDAYRRAFGESALADWLLGKVVKDLAYYYNSNQRLLGRNDEPQIARRVLEQDLKDILLAQQGKDIMLIAHSMGSIIAYNVLRMLGRSHPDLRIAHLVTIGSPLGLPLVHAKIRAEHEYDARTRTPTIVSESWVNFSDPKDPVSFDTHLGDDFDTNRSGIRVRDDLVCNDYHTVKPDGELKANHHKSYGYLRTPELAQHIAQFLAA